MDTKTEIETSLEDVPEKILSQPKASDSGFLMYKNISMIDTIYEFQPMGLRIIIDLPFEGNDRFPIFGIKVTPYIPHIVMESYMMRDPAEANRLLNGMWPISLPYGASLGGETFPDDFRLRVLQHSYPPFISQLAHMYRFWRGSLSYQFRVVSNFTNQAYTFLSTSMNVPHLSRPHSFNFRSINYPWYSQNFSSYMTQAYIPNDLSIQRHAEVTVPYSQELPYYDQHTDMDYAVNATIGTDNKGPVSNFYNWLGYFNRGAITGGTGTNQILLELHMKAEPDFVFTGEIMPMAFPRKTNDYKDWTNRLVAPLNLIDFFPFIIPNKKIQINSSSGLWEERKK